MLGSRSDSVTPLLVYLALLDFGLFALAWRRGWTWLAAAATVLSFGWTFYILADRSADDALLGGLFITVLALAAALLRPGTGRQLALVQPLGLGLLQLAILVARTDVGAPAWGLFGALSLAVVLLAVLRLAWRAGHPAPPLPPHMPAWQRTATTLSHFLLYLLMFAVPLSGWLYSSATGVPTVYLGLLQLPDLVTKGKELAALLRTVHISLNITLLALVCIHVAAALKHHFVDRDNVLRRMLPLQLKRQLRP